MKIAGYFDDHGTFILSDSVKTKFGLVPVGFQTDGFSIPWFFRWFHAPFGKGLVAAIWHDYALKQRSKKAHIQFYQLLRMSNISKRKSTVMYVVVVHYAKLKKWGRNIHVIFKR